MDPYNVCVAIGNCSCNFNLISWICTRSDNFVPAWVHLHSYEFWTIDVSYLWWDIRLAAQTWHSDTCTIPVLIALSPGSQASMLHTHPQAPFKLSMLAVSHTVVWCQYSKLSPSAGTLDIVCNVVVCNIENLGGACMGMRLRLSDLACIE